jgi:DNA-binding NarL/FixJ family response regulator
MASKLLGEFNLLSRRVDAQHGAAPRLTDREVEVLRLVAKGMSNRDISTELVIAENTVKNHVRNILEKLQLKSRMEAAMYAVREKLVEAT